MRKEAGREERGGKGGGGGGRLNSHEVREHDHVLELAREPDEIQRVLVYRDLVGERRGIVAAQPAAAVGADADAEVADAGLEPGVADDIPDRLVDVVVDLRRVRHGRVVLVVQGEEVYVRYQGR